MSATQLSTPPPSPTASPSRTAPAPAAGATGTWIRVAVVSAVLLGSAGVRWKQAERIRAGIVAGQNKPRIDLARIGHSLGPLQPGGAALWEGRDTALDPIIARATGANQIVTRRYVNQQTGATIDAILLFGPAVEMYTHAPEVCYPAAGFAQVAGPDIRVIKTGPTSSPFKSLVYSKGEGGPGELQEVYYSWWYNGRWAPDIGKHKDFERIPTMYKVHLARRVNAGEKRDVGNPCESFLHELLPEMERLMAGTRSPGQ